MTDDEQQTFEQEVKERRTEEYDLPKDSYELFKRIIDTMNDLIEDVTWINHHFTAKQNMTHAMKAKKMKW